MLESVNDPPYREGQSLGCGAALGFVMGLFLAVDVTWHSARHGRWHEWLVAGTVVTLSTVLSGLAVRVMYDRVSRGNQVTPSVLSLGLGFKVGT